MDVRMGKLHLAHERQSVHRLLRMSDNGSPFAIWLNAGVLTLSGKTLAELRIRHIRTQVNSPWTHGKIERFWDVLQSELRPRFVPHADLLTEPLSHEPHLRGRFHSAEEVHVGISALGK